MRADRYYPGFTAGKRSLQWYPDDYVPVGLPLETGRIWYVDGDKSSSGAGAKWEDAFSTIQEGIDAASAGDVVLVAAKTITALATDPVSYAETLIISNAKSNLSLIGVSRGLTQGGLPQIKKASGTTHLLDIRAPGCLIANLGFNGASMTTDGGASGIYLNDDGGTTYVAFGTTIVNCHFKNLGRGHTDAAAAIAIGSNGGAWQSRISSCRFYNCLGGITLLGTSVSLPQDVIVENCEFSSSVNTNVDCDIDFGNGSGVTGVIIRNNHFGTVDVPSHASGSVARYVDLTSCKGELSNNYFACIVGEAETEVTFGASGTAGLVPTTVRMAGNYGETSTTGASNDFGFVFRT